MAKYHVDRAKLKKYLQNRVDDVILNREVKHAAYRGLLLIEILDKLDKLAAEVAELKGEKPERPTPPTPEHPFTICIINGKQVTEEEFDAAVKEAGVTLVERKQAGSATQNCSNCKHGHMVYLTSPLQHTCSAISDCIKRINKDYPKPLECCPGWVSDELA